MCKILLIIKKELGYYFKTWMGYIISASTLLISGILFNAFALGGGEKYSAQVLGDFFYFLSGMAMFAGVMLAMRLIAEEKQTGTIVLLYTSPVTERQIIYGKYLSSLIFLGILLLLSVYMPALIFVNGKVSLGHIFVGYLGVFLLGASVLAITLFCSSLSSNQLLASVLAALVTVVLLVLWMLSEVVNPPFKDLFNYMAIHNIHFSPFMNGIIHIQDIIYYLSIIILFLEGSVKVIETRRYQG